MEMAWNVILAQVYEPCILLLIFGHFPPYTIIPPYTKILNFGRFPPYTIIPTYTTIWNVRVCQFSDLMIYFSLAFDMFTFSCLCFLCDMLQLVLILVYCTFRKIMPVTHCTYGFLLSMVSFPVQHNNRGLQQNMFFTAQ